MRRTLLLDYLYICVLSILYQSHGCLSQTTNLTASCPDGQTCINEERTVGQEPKEARMGDETNQRIQHGQLIAKQTRDTFHQVRRKRELRDATDSVRLQASSNPSDRVGLTSTERRFKKSDHRMDQNSRKLVSRNNNLKINSADESLLDDQRNQDKRDVDNQQGVACRSSASMEKDESKSGKEEARRSSYSNDAMRVIKPKSRAIKESDQVALGSFAKEKLKVNDNGRYAIGLGADAKAQKTIAGNEQLEDDVELDENSAEYEETGDDDDDTETPARNSGYKTNNPGVSQTEEGSEKVDVLQSYPEDDDSEREEIVKRDTGVAEEEYEDIADQDDTCEDVSLVDESRYQQAMSQSKSGLLEEKEKDDSRVKRHDIEASQNVVEKNGASDLNEAARQQVRAPLEHLEDVKIDPGDNSKREISQSASAASSKASLRLQGENSKRQVALENLAKDEQTEPEIKNGSEEVNESSKLEARLQQEVKADGRDTSNAGEQFDERLEGGRNGSGDPISEDDGKEAKVATEMKADVEEDGKSSKQESHLDVTAKENELDSDDEKKVEEQIQQKIESIKEEIKREVEEKQRIREIEANNAKYDEIQSGIEEDEDDDNQSLDVPNERKSISKRSVIDGIRSPRGESKRHILRRVKRSDTTDARQLRAIEGVEELDANVLTKAQFRHESIRKRSAPVYGAIDKDAPDTSKPLMMKRSANPRRVYLVKNKQKRSPMPRGREGRNTIIIPEQAHVNVEDELPPGLSLDPNLLEDPSSPAQDRFKRNLDRFARRRRASAVIPEGRVAFLGYRPQDDDENDEGSEFDDDGFEDRTSNLHQDESYLVPHVPTHDQYHGDESRDENPANFLFPGIDHGRDDFLVRRKRAGIHDEQELASLRGGGALARRQNRARSKQIQAAKVSSRNTPAIPSSTMTPREVPPSLVGTFISLQITSRRRRVIDRDKRQTGNGVDVTKSDSVASLVGSSQELSPRLATEYKEAFGGLQSDPGGALARFKRVKRDSIRGSLD